MIDSDPREKEVQRFRTMQHGRRVHILTVIQPFQATKDQFALVETREDVFMLRGEAVRLNAPLHRGAQDAVADEQLANFLRLAEMGAAAWNDDAVPDGAFDGVTFIVERADANSYAITHICAPRANSPHKRLVDAWRRAFPVIGRRLGG